MRVIVEYDAPDPEEIEWDSTEGSREHARRRQVYVEAELRAPFGWTVENVQVEP